MTQLSTFEGSLDPVAQQDFREAMSRVASAVHIITSDGQAGRCGFTATSFTSVSDKPPLVLCCVNKGARSHELIRANGTFCVNTLSEQGRELAELFASKPENDLIEDRFLGLSITPSSLGLPTFELAQMAMDCQVDNIVDAGTHTVIFGSVINIKLSENAGPGLIYQNRQFQRVQGFD